MRTALSVVLVATVSLVGCSKKDEAPAKKDEAPAKKDEAPAKKDEPAAAVKPPPAPPAPASADAALAPPADALVEHDLSPQGAAWAGWTVKAPVDGRLEADDGTVKGGIAIRWGNGAGAMGFAQKKIDFNARKREFQATGDTKVDRETADQLDATMTMMGTSLKCFYQNRKIGGVQVGCWTVSCVSDDAALARAHEICASLGKK
ncbi:MAG: hypothetical protein SFX73_01835 [Kofleriaceae bacterium]|nr:hypothetical protein [Kofleriaceae bacterium]